MLCEVRPQETKIGFIAKLPGSAMHGDNYGKLSGPLGYIIVGRECYAIVCGLFPIMSNLDFPGRLAK